MLPTKPRKRLKHLPVTDGTADFTLAGKGCLEYPDTVQHPLKEIADFDLKGGQAFGPFDQDFIHFPLPVKNGFHFSPGHLFFNFFFHLSGPRRFRELGFHERPPSFLSPAVWEPPNQGRENFFPMYPQREPSGKEKIWAGEEPILALFSSARSFLC